MTTKSRNKKDQASSPRLRPGELDDLVLGYMRSHKGDGPLTASTIAKGIKGSSGAVANCLGRLTKAKKARLAKRKPDRRQLPSLHRGVYGRQSRIRLAVIDRCKSSSR